MVSFAAVLGDVTQRFRDIPINGYVPGKRPSNALFQNIKRKVNTEPRHYCHIFTSQYQSKTESAHRRKHSPENIAL